MNRLPPPLLDAPREPSHGRRMHGIMIAEYTSRSFWLLLFPLIRGLLALRFDLFSWVQGAWFDILIVGGMLGAAVLRWYCTSYEILPEGIVIRRGVLVRSQMLLPLNRLASASFEASFFYRLVGAMRIRLETDAGSRRHSDFRGTLSAARASELSDALQSEGGATVPDGFRYRPIWGHLLLFAILSSDGLSGVLIASAFFSVLGAFVGRKLNDEVLATISQFAAGIAVNLPPIAVMLSLVLLGGWLFSFTRNVLRYLRFHLWRDSRTGDLRMEMGFFARRSYRLSDRHIHVISIRQTLLTKLLRVASVYVQCSGYGKAKEERAVLIPAAGKRSTLDALRHLLPEWVPTKSRSPSGVRPSPNSFLAYTGPALFCVLGIPALGWLGSAFFPFLQSLIRWTVILAEIPALWAFVLACISFFTSRIDPEASRVVLRYGRGLTLHTAVVPLHKISQIVLRQSIFQKPSKCCDILFHVRSEGRSRHRVKGITLTEAERLRDTLIRRSAGM